MNLNWEYRSEIDAFVNRVLGKELLWMAVGGMRITPFTHDPALPLLAHLVLPLTEIGTPIESKTSMKDRLNSYDPSDILQKALIHHLRYEVEIAAGSAFQNPHNPVWRMPGKLTWRLVRQASYYLSEYFGAKEPFVGLASYRQLLALRNSHVWEPWHQYSQKGDFIYKGEVGKTFLIRWVEVPFFSITGWKPVIFGNGAVARFEVETPCLWARSGFKLVVMKGMMAFANSNKFSGETRIIKLG